MNPEREKEFISDWSKRRNTGRFSYAFRHGVLTFAWPVYVGLEAIKYFSRGDSNTSFSLNLLLFGFITWTVLGLLAYAYIMWPMNEKRYQEIIKKESE